MRTASLLLSALVLSACGPGEPPDDGVLEVAEPTSTVTVAYEGRLQDGTVFDASDRATFSLLQVIPGFQAGIAGMTEGESKTLSLTPEQGYGASPPPGSGIPPNAPLVFDVTLIEVE
ncbi:FKBP-type peptidyl-prolyl cis-trans isomerase [Rubrivirga sp.]|uniref:FKBP-type peptidyl-prolyl cis-trans isomerase n=1 Tax=Rubrivirga sp. TaxID=1885344 RepID=UPI003C748655